MRTRRSISVKPLAAALTLALGAGSAAAATPSLATFKTHMDAFRSAAAQAKQYLAEHRNDKVFFRKSHAHKLTRPNLHHLTAPATMLTVTSCVDNASSATTPGTLRYAVLNAANGDTIDLSACNNSTITLTQGALPVAVDGLTITGGGGSNNVTIDANAADRAFYVTAPATYSNNYLTLSYLTVRNGAAPPPANPGYAAIGGCIYANNEGVALIHATVTGCKAVNANGAAAGGGIAAYGLFMYQGTLSGNTVTATLGTSSSAAAVGGGAIVRGKYTTYTLSSSISGNTVQSNGGYLAEAGGLWAFAPYLNDTRIMINRVEQNAGSASQPYVGAGGGLVVKYGGTVLNSTISGNAVVCTTTNTTSNNAVCFGGGVINPYSPSSGQGTLDISYSTVSGNSGGFFGGGVLSKYGLSLTQSTITGNSAALGAGIAEKYNSTGLTVYNSTIARNAAKYVGGGIYLGANGSSLPPVTLVSSIVANGQAPYGGADIYLSGTSTLTISGSNDLVTAVSSNIVLPAGTLSADPMLGPLNANGGPTPTMGLYPGSPALGTGSNPNSYSYDQRGPGFARTVNGLTDIGAFQGTVAPPVPAPTLSAWALALLAGLLGLFGWRRRRTQ